MKELKIQYLTLAFIASSFMVTEENLLFGTGLSGLSFECFHCSSLLLKELSFIVLFVITAAYVVPCGGPKNNTAFSGNILKKSENIVSLDSCILNRQLFWTIISLSVFFGVRVLVTFHLTCIHIFFCSVWDAEWPPFGK